jgi:SAM-dependent methyltransferase
MTVWSAADEDGEPVSTTSPEEFDAMYEGAPAWDIGHPQPALLRLAESGALRGPLLDLGCGTGEHALMAAALGLEAAGIDASPAAVALAQAKAGQRHLAPRFVVGNVLDLAALELAAPGRRFATALDSGLFHVFDDPDRARYVENLGEAVAPGGRLYILCFTEAVPGDWGPRRIRPEEIRTAFPQAAGWQVESIEPAAFETTSVHGSVPAWLCTVHRR